MLRAIQKFYLRLFGEKSTKNNTIYPYQKQVEGPHMFI